MTGIYIHIPFCVHKCFYCDFYSKTDLKGFDVFSDALIKEIEIRSEKYPDKKVIDTIFFGGGTPSLMPPEMTERIFSKIYEKFDVKPDAEITIECNPGTVTGKLFETYKKFGVNRLSFGVQSFNEKELHFLERIHDSDETVKSVNDARTAGFENISIDLIFSIPSQTHESLNHTLKRALELEPDHISYYSLIYEPGTPLYKEFLAGKIHKTDSETDATNYETIIDFLVEHGYQQYEVSNFARNDKKCIHNLIYWHGEEYFGFGPSAHGYLANERYWNWRNLSKYNNLLNSESLPTEGSEILTPKNKFEELVYMGLRADGINLDKIEEEFGIMTTNKLLSAVKSLKIDECFKFENNLISLTRSGYMICDELSVKILSSIEK